MRSYVSVPTAMTFSFLLFLLMSALIANKSPSRLTSVTPPITIEVTVPDTPLSPITRRDPIKLPVLKPLPSDMAKDKTIRNPQVIAKPEQSFPLDLPSPGEGLTISSPIGQVGNYADQGDREAIPQVVIDPGYPTDAAIKGIEGFVTLRFDLDSSGHPTNIQVIAAKPKGVFEKNARQALSKWRYAPKMEQGSAVTTSNLQVTLDFKLAGK